MLRLHITPAEGEAFEQRVEGDSVELVEERTGEGVTDAFRRTVASFEGSVAIGAATAVAPDRLQLALRGSGQALYVGLADDAYIVASEPYGLIETTSRWA